MIPRGLPLLLLAGCGGKDEGVTFYVPVGEGPALTEFVRTIGDERLTVEEADDPVAAVKKSRATLAVAVVDTGADDQSWRVDATDGGWIASGAGPLGERYAMGEVLEGHGWRFFHPEESALPAGIGEPDTSRFGVDHVPTPGRRGLHLHTLHPIDPLWAFWTGDDPDGAAATMDWVIRNHGNHLQWVALDDITTDLESGFGDRYAAWQSDTAALLARAHEQGLTTGLGIQLFGTSNLQLAFDLVDTPGTVEEMRPEMDARLASITDGLDWDVLNLSFGEFSGVEPEDFIDATNLMVELAAEHAPAAEVCATIHVGNYDDLRVSWKGQEMLYYFLVQYADPRITPWVHSVMYYTLFEDAGLAYDHEEFDEHRQFLLDRLQAGDKVGYFPETAYWVAFDNSVPTYLPLYMRSRWTDLVRIQAEADAMGVTGLRDHVLFSTGWEWGYWQNDYAALRMTAEPPASWEEVVHHMYAPFGGSGEDIAQRVIDAANVEHAELLVNRWAAYLAGRDDVIDLGDHLDIHSQPDRPGFDELQGWSADDLAAFEATLDRQLGVWASAPFTGADTLRIDDDPAGPWAAEIADGLTVTGLRGQYTAYLFRSAVKEATGRHDEALADLAAAEALLPVAQDVVSARHGAMHSPNPERLVVDGYNPTLYLHGYLRYADDLCYWHREYAEASNLVAGTTLDVPACIP